MEKVTMDFQFPVMDKVYGTFLVALYENVEDAKLTDVKFLHPDSLEKNQIFVSVTVPEDIAMLLKLQFSGNMRKRPPFPELSKYKLKELKILDEYKYENIKDISDHHLP